ncbi:hypothetical protein BGZ96_005048 [Linnemannia gamsii]|uniref:Uncharacterized protein n=1 Tax=Linnemannia gamsii TaxID=64522 RepID=A0ABQ7K4P9_9FUNG|nr:hypothetical protein BGZ96_005048 [Linnemannia gamsii]
MAAHSNYTNPNAYNPTPSVTATATGTSTAPSSVAGRDVVVVVVGGIQGPSAPSSPTSAPSQQYYRRSKDELDLPIASANQLHHLGDPNLYPIPTSAAQQGRQSHLQLDRHSFIMPSESISVYSTWTGDLSDVTNTSGEVSVGAFLDRKQASAMHYSRRKSGDKLHGGPGSHLSTSSVGTIHQALHGSGSGSGSGGNGSGGNGSGGEEMRKSQYSLGSYGSRASAGNYSNYSNHSSGSGGPLTVSGPLSEAFGSGPMVVSASLSSVGQPSGTAPPGTSSATATTTAVAAAGGAGGDKQQQQRF